VEHPLPRPFIVLATQNPIEYEGTYPLPEAQLDRFLMKVVVSYPSQHDEETMLKLRRFGVAPVTLSDVEPVASMEDVSAIRRQVDEVAASDEIISYVASVVRRTRELPSVALGASPRAAVHLLAAARALATMNGRSFVVPDDVVALAGPVLAHRLLLTPEAELDRFSATDALSNVLASVPIPR
jgi:MoxR-like ATPase